MRTIQRISIVVLCLSAALLIQGCPRDNSCNIDTAGLFCNFEVVDNGTEVTATAVFSVGGALGTQLRLGTECGDSITVNGQAMQLFQNLGVYYQATIPRAAQYEFVFTRGETGEEYHGVATTPPAIIITAPGEGETKSRAEAFDVAWEDNNPDSEEAVALWVGGSCTAFAPQQMADIGLYTVNAGTIKPRNPNNPDASCDATIVLTRRILGVLDEGIQGMVWGKSTASSWITSAP